MVGGGCSGDYFGDSTSRRGGTGTGYVPLTFETKDYNIQKKIGDILESKYSYGFGSEKENSDTIYFFDGENIFAQIYENGKIEISPFIDSKILINIEKIVGGKN